MPKTPHTFKLSKQAEQDIAEIRARFPYLNDTTAVEFAVWVVAHSHAEMPVAATPAAYTAPAARPARPKAATKEQMK